MDNGFHFPAHSREVTIEDKQYTMRLDEPALALLDANNAAMKSKLAALSSGDAEGREAVDKESNCKVLLILLGREAVEDIFGTGELSEMHRWDLDALVRYLTQEIVQLRKQ